MRVITPRRAGRALLISVVLAVACLDARAPAGEPYAVDLKPENVDLWSHRLGPETAVHVSAFEYRTLRSGVTSLSFQIVVSANGRVESAYLVGGIRVHAKEGRAIEMKRRFRPWMVNGVPTAVRLRDYVSLLPPEESGAMHVSFPEPWDLHGASVQLSRTMCFGTCPVYRLTIAGDGTVHFSGHAFVLIPGDHVAHIDPSAVRSLILDFEKADFFSAKDTYEAMVTDVPAQTITLTVDGHTKKIVDYMGTEAGMPLAIHNLEGEVDEVADSARWIKGDESTLSSLQAEHWPFGAASSQNLAMYDAAISAADQPLVDRFIRAHAPIVAPWATYSDLGPVRVRILSPVCAASAKGDLDRVERMLRSARTPPESREKGLLLPQRVLNECLLTATRSGDLEMSAYWLDHGADLKAQPADNEMEAGWGVLANAIQSGNAELVRLLIHRGADVQAPIYIGNEQPILNFAVACPREEEVAIVAILIEGGADVNARDSRGETPVFDAGRRPEIVKLLVAAGADVNARDKNGYTPLMTNAYIEPTVRQLLAYGADPAPVNVGGETASTIARQMSCPKCAALIEEALKKPHTNSRNLVTSQ